MSSPEYWCISFYNNPKIHFKKINMQLARIKDVANRYSMSPSTFYRWHCYGKYPQLFAKIGKVLFIDESELRKMAKQSKEEATNG